MDGHLINIHNFECTKLKFEVLLCVVLFRVALCFVSRRFQNIEKMKRQIPTSLNFFELYKTNYKFTKKQLSNLDWGYITYDYTSEIDEQFIEKFKDYIDEWYYIWSNKKWPIKFIEKYIDYVDFHTISEHQKLTQKFIKKYWKKLSDFHIFKYQKLTEKFIEKYKNETNIFNIRFNKYIKNPYTILWNIGKIVLKEFQWGNLSNNLVELCMAYDAQHHPNPKLFDEWANNNWGSCPYSESHHLTDENGSPLKRQILFFEQRSLWSSKLKTIKLPSDNKLLKMLIDYKNSQSPGNQNERPKS